MGRGVTRRKLAKKREVAPPRSAAAVVSRRKPFAFYSHLGLTHHASAKQIASAIASRHTLLKAERKKARTPQAIGAKTKALSILAEIERTLCDPDAKTDYDTKNGWFAAESLRAVRRHRHALPKKEKLVVSAMTQARKVMKRHGRLPSSRGRTAARKVTTNVGNKTFGSLARLDVCCRSRAERKDRRKKKFFVGR